MDSEEFVDLFTKNRPVFSIRKNPDGRRIIKANSIKTDESPAGEHEQTTGLPRIELQKNGDVVSAITVVCTCGREIKIVLEYENDQAKNGKIVTEESKVAY